MYRFLKCLKDTCITNKIIAGSRCKDANTGEAGTSDIYKLYNETRLVGSSGSVIELSRLLLKFDLSNITELTSSALDISDPSFKCYINLSDIYGGQTIPSNYQLDIFPLAKPFSEGRGKDVVAYRDVDGANFLTSSITNGVSSLWNLEGCSSGGTLGTSGIDYFVSGNLLDGSGVVSLKAFQTFPRGDEDLLVDVTTVVSATVAGIIPDYGFRVSLSDIEETDNKTYFVKRFYSRHVTNKIKVPKLIFKVEDAIEDQTSNLYFDTSNETFIYNSLRGEYNNITSGTTEISGSNCLLLNLVPITSSVTSSYSLTVTGSQHQIGNNLQTGIYSAIFNIPSNASNLSQLMGAKTFLYFKPTWKSLDNTKVYSVGSPVKVQKILPVTNNLVEERLVVNITNLWESYCDNEIVRLRVFAQNYVTSLTIVRLPTPCKSLIYNNMYYSVRDAYKQNIIIPFDTVGKSTKLSTDSDGMYFDLHMEDFEPDRVYSIQLMIFDRSQGQIFGDAGEFLFKVTRNR